MMRRYPISTIVTLLTCSHGFLFGLIIGTVTVLTSSESERGIGTFVEGVLIGMLGEALVTFIVIFSCRKQIPRASGD
jgi:hypothetical protein